MAKVLNKNTISACVKNAEYAVRGAIVQRAEELMQLKAKGVKLNFDKLYKLNIGNPLVLGQPVFTFNRAVLGASMFPENLKTAHPDVQARANKFLKSVEYGQALGAYTDSAGLKVVRQSIKDFIEARDEGVKVDANELYLTNGASDGVTTLLQMIITKPNDGILIPIPQYPLYTALISLFGGAGVPYYLNEEKSWSLDLENLQHNYEKAKKNGTDIKAMVVINPGNPTGQVLTTENMESIVKFCKANKLMLLADEVYQENIYTDKKWTSFRKIIHEMSKKEDYSIEIASFHSTSKGLMGECGFRGGYCELVNFDSFAMSQFLKLRSIGLCSNSWGQLLTELMVNPPKDGRESKETVSQYNKEKDSALESLKTRAKMLSSKLNGMKRMKCNVVEGAMYAFPRILLTKSAIEAAKKKGMAPDGLYCLECLEETGIIIVPGSGFRQVPGTFHFRITNLIYDLNEFEEAMTKLNKFNDRFYERYP